MTLSDCEAAPLGPRDQAKALILKTLGVKRVAHWCGVEEATVYQWLSRGTDEEPIPTNRVAPIVKGARADGLDAPLAVLWPAMAGAGE
jgi:hypothetical protein